MKIIRVSTLLDFGGVEKRLVNFAKSCPDNVNVLFISLGKGGWASSAIESLGKQVICLNSSFKIPNILLILKLVKLFKQLKPDVVHSSGSEANFHAQVAALIAGVKVRISEEIGFPKHNNIYINIFKIIYSNSSRLVCISEAVADRVVELGEATRDKITVVYNPISYTAFEKKSKNNRDIKRFITVCRLDKIKNLDTLITSFAELTKQNPNIELKILGDGPEKQHLLKLADEYNVNSKIEFVGFTDNPYDYLLSSDIFVLLSFSEGLGNAIMEAMLAGLPCIVSNVGGGKELIEDGKNGWLINPYNPKDIQEKMSLALSLDTSTILAMGQESQRLLKTNFSSETHWEKLLKIYKGE